MKKEIAVGEQVRQFFPRFDMPKEHDSSGYLSIGFCLEFQTERAVAGDQKAVVLCDITSQTLHRLEQQTQPLLRRQTPCIKYQNRIRLTAGFL